MKNKAVKIILFVFALIVISVLSAFAYYFIATMNSNLDKSKLINVDSHIELYDVNGNLLEQWSNGKSITDADDIPEYTFNAFVAIEDKRFYSHNGIDPKGFLRAAFNNIKSFSFKEGASTISQQLIKNTHLSGEKTLKRKLIEIKLARQLEKNYTKKQILEMYLNTIYFGEGCYGITSACNRYFGISPSELTINQSAALAGIIKAPATYSPTVSIKNCNERKNVVLKEMFMQNYISKSEYELAVKTDLTVYEKDADNLSPYLNLVKKEAEAYLENNSRLNVNYKIYTCFDPSVQKSIDEVVENTKCKYDLKIMALDENNRIQAFYSTCGDVSRQMGSTIKPIAVYAPAIDMGIIDSCTPIKDEKIKINGYSPSNYKNKYYGYVSAKFALAKSLNSCAVKILNDCGTEKCANYLKKTNIPITKKDYNLSLALGSTEKGATLTEISAAYGAFINKGEYFTPTTIIKITDENGNTVYFNKQSTRIYEESTAFIINDVLKSTVKEGTAKTLSALNIPIAAKTGTVGNENGNTDAYTVSYTGNKIVSCWVGNADSTLMENSVSGGTLPAEICRNVWKSLINNGFIALDTFYSDSVAKINIDKLSYNENHKVEKADENFPDRYVLTEYFKKGREPKTVSERFSIPKIETANISVNNKGISIRLCLPEYCEYKIYRKCGEKETLLFDSYGKKNKSEFTDKYVIPETKYIYYIVPYVNGKNGIKTGVEYRFEEIKTPPIDIIDDDIWKDYFLE